MGYFAKFKDRIIPSTTSYTLSTSYQTMRVDVPRTRHIESMEIAIGIEMDIGTADNVSFTKLMDGLANVVRKVTFQAGGHNYINGVSGAGLLRYAANVDAIDDVSQQAIVQGTTADDVAMLFADRPKVAAVLMERALSFTLRYPLYFGHPQVQEPTTAAFYVPMPVFGQDGVLEVEFGKLAEIATLGTGVASIIITPIVIINQRACPSSMPHYRHELNEYEENYTATGQKEFKLNALGSYTGILAAYFNDSWVETDPCANGGLLELVIGSTSIAKARPKDFISENSRSKATGRGVFETASPFLDFLTDGFAPVAGLNSVLDANPANVGGARFSLLTTIDTLSTSVKARYLTHRVYGDLKALKVSA